MDFRHLEINCRLADWPTLLTLIGRDEEWFDEVEKDGTTVIGIRQEASCEVCEKLHEVARRGIVCHGKLGALNPGELDEAFVSDDSRLWAWGVDEQERFMVPMFVNDEAELEAIDDCGDAFYDFILAYNSALRFLDQPEAS